MNESSIPIREEESARSLAVVDQLQSIAGVEYRTSTAAQNEGRAGSLRPDDTNGIAVEAAPSAERRGDLPDPVVHKGTNRKPSNQLSRSRLPKQANLFMPAMTLEVALARHDAVAEFTRKLMVRDQDFGEILGNNKPALLKPGAEKLCNFFGFEPEFTPVIEEIDWTGARHSGDVFCYVRYQCRLLRQGRTCGVGEGSCNSWESRYRYVWVNSEQLREDLDRTYLPKQGGKRTLCEFEFAVERAETAGAYGKPVEYWDQFQNAIAAGNARRVERDSRQGKLPAWEIDVDTTLYRIPNPDVADIVNTIQKMAQKRAFVAATLIATSTSEFFTQDLEDTSRDGNTPSVRDTDQLIHAKGAASETGTSFQSSGRASAASYRPNLICKPWRNFGQMRQYFDKIRERVG